MSNEPSAPKPKKEKKTRETYISPYDHYCTVCGRPVKVINWGKKGRKRRYHFNCRMGVNFLVAAKKCIGNMIWEHPYYIHVLRGDLQVIQNDCFNSRKDVIFAPGTCYDDKAEYLRARRDAESWAEVEREAELQVATP